MIATLENRFGRLHDSESLKGWAKVNKRTPPGFHEYRPSTKMKQMQGSDSDFIIVPWVPLKTDVFLTVLSCRREATLCGDSSMLWVVWGSRNPATSLLSPISLFALQNLYHFCKKRLSDSVKSCEWHYKCEKFVIVVTAAVQLDGQIHSMCNFTRESQK